MTKGNLITDVVKAVQKGRAAPGLTYEETLDIFRRLAAVTLGEWKMPDYGRLTCLVLFALSLASPASAQTFSTDFDDPDAGGSHFYGFSTRSPLTWASGNPNDGAVVPAWATTFLPTGDYDGSGAVKVDVFGCASQACEDDYLEGLRAWTVANIGGSYTQGVSVRYIRIRMKMPDTYDFALEESWNAKFVDFGNAGASRVLVMQQGVEASEGCSANYPWGSTVLGNPDTWAGNSNTWWASTDWGKGWANWNDPDIFDKFFTMSVHIGVNVPCAGPLLIVESDHPENPKANWGGSAPVDGWYWIQIAAISGTAGNAGFKMWANNCDENNPDSVHTNIPDAFGGAATPLDVTNWEGNVYFGAGYVMTRDTTADYTQTYGHFGVSNSFDNTFCPAGSPPPSAPPRRWRLGDLNAALGLVGLFAFVGTRKVVRYA